MATMANPTVSDYIPTVFPKEIKKSDVRIVKMLNNYFNILKVSCGTIKVNTLHRMCLLKLIKDILDTNGLLYPYMSDEDKKVWGKYLGNCFTELTYDDGGTDETVEENICPDEDGGGDTPTPTPTKSIVSIAVENPRTEFYINTPFSLGDGIVWGTYDDNTRVKLSPNQYRISGYDTSSVGTQQLTVRYRQNGVDTDITTTYNIIVSASYITSIAITRNPSVTEFYVDGTLTFDGIVTGYYNSGGELIVTPLVWFTGDDFSTPGEKTIWIHYRNSLGQEVPPVSYIINVLPKPDVIYPVSLSLINPKTTFNVGDSFIYAKDSASSIIATYNDNSTVVVSPADCGGLSNINTNTAGSQEITVSYTDAGHTVTNRYTITVVAPTPVATKWYIGTSDNIPTSAQIKAGTNVPLVNSLAESPILSKVVFWIAIPEAKTFVQATSTTFEGNTLSPEDFNLSFPFMIDGIKYKLYYRVYTIPANSKFNVYII